MFFFQDLYNLLQQFYQLFPELVDNPFFAMGESYGGKWVLKKNDILNRNIFQIVKPN